MSTRSTISLLNEKDGTVSTVYCHYDGYVKGGVGEALLKNFKNSHEIEDLINKGELRSVIIQSGSLLVEAFDKPRKPNYFSSLGDYDYNCDKQGYNYLFVNGEWVVELPAGNIRQVKHMIEE